MSEQIGKSPENLLKRIRANRQSTITVRERITLTLSRPTDREMADWYRAGARDADLYMNHVSDWKGVTENDLVGGGGTDAVPFDTRLWREWIVDQLDLWQPIVERLIGDYEAHRKDMEAVEKK